MHYIGYDIDNIINSYIDNKVETAFEVGLYNLSKDEKKIIKKVETNELLEKVESTYSLIFGIGNTEGDSQQFKLSV